MKKLFGAKSVWFLLAALLMLPSLSLASDLLLQQLQSIVTFDRAQQENTGKNGAAIIENFVKTQKGGQSEEAFSPESIAAIEAFLHFAFDGNLNENPGKAFRALNLAGRADFTASAITCSKHGPFAEHVVEAIKCNRERTRYYETVSQGRTRALSKSYIALEQTILPVARIFDRWAARFWAKDIPVMRDDFVSMAAIPPAATCPERMGRLSPAGIKDYRRVLKTFRKNVYRAAAGFDFVKIQIEAIAALTSLKRLQLQHRCNLSLSIHLIESVGLAGRNAHRLKREHNGKADSFYRLFIIMQTLGVKMFADIDVKAQYFHQEGIGIIVNDLPAIPFP